MPNTPHSSRSVAPSRSGSLRSADGPKSSPELKSKLMFPVASSSWLAVPEESWFWSIAPLFCSLARPLRYDLFGRRLLDQLFKAVAGRLAVAVAAGCGRIGLSLFIVGLVLLEFL